MKERALPALACAAWWAACAPAAPCTGARGRLARAASAPYLGRWEVVRGDTLTLPQMGDRFRLAVVRLDTGSLPVAQVCRFLGRLIFTEPRAETLGVTWRGEPDQAFIWGWPADLGPFGGLGVTVAADSMRGALLFDSRLGINVTPGVTAQFVARRVPAQ